MGFILALDGLDLTQSLNLTRTFSRKCYAVKGHSLFDQYGQEAFYELREAGAKRIWADVKCHDTPKTVGLRRKILEEYGAGIITVHTSGGIEMMMVACEDAMAEIYAVTLLTSIDHVEAELICGRSPAATVLYRAQMAKLAGAPGVVCSAEEVGMLRQRKELRGLRFIVPGTRSVGKDLGDQKRVGTPAQAVLDGATHLVIGSQIVDADDPIAAFREIQAEVAAVAPDWR